MTGRDELRPAERASVRAAGKALDQAAARLGDIGSHEFQELAARATDLVYDLAKLAHDHRGVSK